MSRGHAVAVIGAQYGSEGKGAVVAAMASEYDCFVRVGGANAGHTFFHEGRKFVARSIPIGWINPDARIYIGPGAVIDLKVLKEELNYIESYGHKIRDRVMVDERAIIISHSQHLAEGGVKGKAHAQIGSTGEGVGLARMAKINRDALINTDSMPYRCIRVEEEKESFEKLHLETGDVASKLHLHLREGAKVLLEGTQGCGLSLTLGEWPHVTSADTNAAQLASDAGISPTDVAQTILVARTYPIRVAGPSGPLYDETSWEELGLEPEITTVTKKVRRVGRWNPEQIRYACQINYPAAIVVTFIDYLWPEAAGVVDWRSLPDTALEWIDQQEELLETPIIAVGTGPDTYCKLRQKAGINGLPVYVAKEKV